MSSSIKSTSSDEKLSPEPVAEVVGSGKLPKRRREARIIAQGPEAQQLAEKYAETMSRHSRLNPENTPSFKSRIALLAFVGLIFYYAIQTRMQVIEYKRSLQINEPWDQDYTDLEHMMPMAEDAFVKQQYGRIEL